MHVWVVAAVLGQAAWAEDSEFEGTEEAGQLFEETETRLSVELGGALAKGNTDFWVINGLGAASHKWHRNQVAGEAGANLGQGVGDADGDGRLSEEERSRGLQQTAEKYWLEVRYDRFVGQRDSLYVLLGALVDPFAGYDLRSHEQIGYSRILLETDTRVLAEVGMDIAQEVYVPDVEPGYANVLAARAMVGIDHWFSDDVAFVDTLEAYENVVDLEDLRVLNEVALTTRLSDVFSVKLSHKLTWDNRPVEGFRSTDHTALVTLVASVF